MTQPDDTVDPFELLDAYADGELTDAERAVVSALLERSAEARAEVADIERVRALVRGLPEVDAPFGFYERLRSPDRSHQPSRRRRRAPGVVFASVLAVAAAVVLVVAIAPVGHRLAPPVEDLSQRHAMLASSTQALPEGYTPMAADAADSMAPYEAPEAVDHGYQRIAVYRAPEGVHVVYRNDTGVVSVFEQRGRVEWDAMPSGGARTQMDGADAWTVTISPSASGTGAASASAVDVVVLARDDLIVTVVGSAPHDDVVAVAEAVPNPPPPSMTERVEDTCGWIAEGFGFPA